jgi:hypothetical protein
MDDDDPTYTVDEARALLPVIRATLLQLAIERRRVDASHDELHRRLRHDSDGNGEDLPRLEATTETLRTRVRDLLDHLESLGVVIRDLDAGLVDIPTERDGEPAWLCWRLADPELGFWHTTREGYSTRRPL